MKSLLFILIMFVALTSIVSGLLMISDPSGKLLNLPLTLLNDTQFKDFLTPGILLTFVGAMILLAAFFNAQQYRGRYSLSIGAGILISGWITAQMILITTVHWLHFIYLFTGLMIIFIAFKLKSIEK